MDWVEEYGEVGLEEVHRLDLVVPPEDIDKLFLMSSLAEDVLHTVCARTLGITQGVRVKLAGEIMQGPGM